MMKRLLGLCLALFLPALVSAQEVKKATLFYRFDVDSGTVTYPLLTGLGGDPFASPMSGPTKISTSGSSATVTSTTASTNAFALLSVGDVIVVKIGPDATPSVRYITAKASADSITVDSAIDLSADATGYFFSWYKLVSGTAATNGWFNVTGYTDITVAVQYDQGDLGALGVRWECRVNSLDTQPIVVYPGEADTCGAGGTLSSNFCSFATAGIDSRLAVVIGGKWDACRVGLKFITSDTSDAGANLEQVTATVVMSPRR